MENSTHFKKVKNSKFLGSCDLERGKTLNATIKEVVVNEVPDQSGKKGNCNVAIFTDSKIKPMILNMTNCKQIRTFAGGSPYIEDWSNINITIYIDYKIRVGSQIVDGLRISPVQPKKELPNATEAQIKQAIIKIESGKSEKEPVIKWFTSNTKITTEQLEKIKKAEKNDTPQG